MTQEINPASIRYQIAGRIYMLGTRVMTDSGLGSVVGFEPGAYEDIGVKLDSDGTIVWADWRGADLVDDEPVRSEDAEDRYRLRFG